MYHQLVAQLFINYFSNIFRHIHYSWNIRYLKLDFGTILCEERLIRDVLAHKYCNSVCL